MASPLFRKFLGLSRFDALRAALGAERQTLLEPDPFYILGSLTLLVCYSAVVLLSKSAFLSAGGVLTIGAICLVGLVLWYRLRDRARGSIFSGLSNIHTAFAVGAVPALLLVLFFRSSFMQGVSVGEAGSSSNTIARTGVFLTILGVSVFAGVSEEIIFRGLTLSALRRLWFDRPWRDAGAIAVSSILFGAFHAVMWGSVVGLALAGIGAGIGAGYVASKERLAPVILYHSLFDFLSLAAAVYLTR